MSRRRELREEIRRKMSSTEGWIVCMGDRGPELARESEFENATDTDDSASPSAHEEQVTDLERARRDLMAYVNAWPAEPISEPRIVEQQALQKVKDYMAHWQTDLGYEASFGFFLCMLESPARSYEGWLNMPGKGDLCQNFLK